MIRKIFYLLLLLLLLLFIAAAACTQTPYFKEKLKEYLIQRSSLDIKMGKLEGIFPFWMKVNDIELHINNDDVIYVEKSSFTLSPFSLLWNQLSFIHLQASTITIKTAQKKGEKALFWPYLPLPLQIYSLDLERVTYNSLPTVNISGSMDIEAQGGNFTLDLTIKDKKNALHINVGADAQTKEIALITNLTHPSLTLWSGGILALKEENFNGSVHGKGTLVKLDKPWKFSSKLALDKNLNVTMENLLLDISGLSATGSLSFDKKREEFRLKGAFENEPFLSTGTLTLSEERVFTLSHFQLGYLDNQIKGNLLYNFSTEECEANLQLHLQKLENAHPLFIQLFNFHDPLRGTLKADLSLHKEQYSCKADLLQFGWNDFSISKGSVHGKWEKSKPLAFTVDLYDFDILDPRYEVLPTVHIKAEGTLSKETFKMMGSVGGWGTEPFTLNCNMPMTLHLAPFSYSIDRTRPFSIKFTGRGSIDPLLAFLENASLIVQGELDSNIEISGVWGDSQISGYMNLLHGQMQDLTTGAFFKNVEMRVKGDAKRLLITSLKAEDSNSGKIVGDGEITWNIEEHFPFHINFKAEHFLLFALDRFTATTDAQITLSGTLQKVLIAGESTIVKGMITIPNKLPVTIPKLEVTYLHPLVTPTPEKKSSSSFPITVTWDVALHIPKKLEIEGRGFYSDWKGDLTIKGSGETLTYSGALTLIEGRFDFARRSFHLNKGTIKIEGIEPKNFYIDVEGSTEIATLIVFMNVKGYLDNTAMNFSSSPPMNTEQIFSRLLFDSDLNELTAFQAYRLAKFLVTLSGKYTGPSAFDNFKGSLGIDVFDITHCDIDSMDFTFQVGKYISQGTYVGINKSISGEFDSVEIQTHLYQDFFLQANYGGSLNGLTPNGGKIIFKWYKTY